MKKNQCIKSLLILFLLLFCQLSDAQTFETKFVQYDPITMAKIKSQINNKTSLQAHQKLFSLADNLLQIPPPSVVDKTFEPPSGNIHDYLSISRYWWPDPAKEDGLPWIRKDGITNPSTQTDDVDRKRLGVMANMVQVLSLAYYLSGQEKYAAKTASVLKTWFINPETRMNPHLQYAQSVPGNPNGRRSGILDGRLIPQYVLDAIHIVSVSPHWQSKDTESMNHWLSKYLAWLTQSELGQKGAQQTNNHGSWYFFQVASLAYYLNEQALLSSTIEQVKMSFEYQFDKQGRQPHELARTRSFFYSCFNLDAITSIAEIAVKANQSIWSYQSKNGVTLELAINVLIPALQGGEWPYKTPGIKPMDITQLLIKFDKHSTNDKYAKVLRNIIKRAQHSGNGRGSSSNDVANDKLLQIALFAPEYLEDN